MEVMETTHSQGLRIDSLGSKLTSLIGTAGQGSHRDDQIILQSRFARDSCSYFNTKGGEKSKQPGTHFKVSVKARIRKHGARVNHNLTRNMSHAGPAPRNMQTVYPEVS